MDWGTITRQEEKAERAEIKRNRKIDLILTGQKKPSDDYIVRKLRAVWNLTN